MIVKEIHIEYNNRDYKKAVKWLWTQPWNQWIPFTDVPEGLLDRFFEILDNNAAVVLNTQNARRIWEMSFILHEMEPCFKITGELGILNREKQIQL